MPLLLTKTETLFDSMVPIFLIFPIIEKLSLVCTCCTSYASPSSALIRNTGFSTDKSGNCKFINKFSFI